MAGAFLAGGLGTTLEAGAFLVGAGAGGGRAEYGCFRAPNRRGANISQDFNGWGRQAGAEVLPGHGKRCPDRDSWTVAWGNVGHHRGCKVPSSRWQS